MKDWLKEREKERTAKAKKEVEKDLMLCKKKYIQSIKNEIEYLEKKIKDLNMTLDGILK